MNIFVKKNLQSIFKRIGQKIFLIIYGKIKGFTKELKKNGVEVVKSKIGRKLYKVYLIRNGRLYTDTVNDTAIISRKTLVKGASYQYRLNLNVNPKKNIVFEKGTPRIKKILSGTILSTLSGGAGNSNYWHWLFDVLPRLKIVENILSLKKINFFLVPSIKKKFQLQSLKLLKIKKNKILPSENFRHIQTNSLIVTDHPYVFKNNPSKEIQNIPIWIIDWLKEKFVSKKKRVINQSTKIFIDRDNSKDNRRRIINHKELLFFFKNKGFKIIKLENLSFLKQVSFFSNAKIIAGLHGAGFANIVFAKKKTMVIEIKPVTAGNVIRNLSIKNNLNYKSLSVKPLKNLKNQFGEIYVSLKKLDNLLNK